ncbi:MAG: MOSC domain-containing protein [Candidatus Puniceispirillaceae bacterium]
MYVDQLWRFPFKGFAGHKTNSIALQPHSLFPGDRQFAISTGHPASNDRLSEGWLAKRHFIQQSMVPALAAYQLDYHAGKSEFSLAREGEHLLSVPHDKRHLITDRLAADLPEAFSGTPQMVELGTGGYTDTAAPWISLCTTASLEAFADATGTLPDNRRFRLNLVIAHDMPFDEFSWAGKMLEIGESIEIEIIEPVGRCSAINVHPDKAEIEADYLASMPRLFDHTDLGMFARINRGGTLKTGDIVRLCDSL